MALLVLALLAAVAIGVASRKPSAEELVRLSQAAHRDPPAFTMTTTALAGPAGGMYCPLTPDYEGDPGTLLRFVYDGDRSFREECYFGSQISEMSVTDGTTAGLWKNGAWQETGGRFEIVTGLSLPAGVSAATVGWLNWLGVGQLDDPPPTAPGALTTCSKWTLGSTMTVAGRPSTEVVCGPVHYWIDDTSRLLVRIEVEDKYSVEALELQVGAEPAATLFSVVPPDNVRSALTDGDTPPDWILPLVDGVDFAWSSLRGRPVVALVSTTPNCAGAHACIGLETFAAAVGERTSEIHAIAVADRTAFSDRELAAAAAAGIPVVFDDGTAATGWLHRPGVSFFDAAGRYRLTVDPRSSTSLTAAIDAFVHETPIPPMPPGDGTFAVGRPAPRFVTETLDGRTFDLSSLGGKPVVVLAPAWEVSSDVRGRDATRTLVGDLASAHALVGDRVSFVVIAWNQGYGSSPAAGWAEVMADVRAEFGTSVDDIHVVKGRTYAGLDGWTALAWIGGDPQVWEASIVVVNADGVVARLLIEPLPAPHELVEIVAEVEGER
jgi:peroxiredoxin